MPRLVGADKPKRKRIMVTARILDNFFTFGIDFAVEQEYKRLIRAGMGRKCADNFANRMVQAVLCTPKK